MQYPSRYKATWEDGETRKSQRFTKLEAWRLRQYRKIVLIDTDTLVLKNIDALFTCAESSAVADAGAPGHFNSGVFVLSPSEATYQELLRLAPLLISYNMGDQGFLNKAFPEWRLRPERQLPESYNYFPKWRGTNAWYSKTWAAGVHIVHFTDVVKPHNWFLYPSMPSAAGPARLSFVAQQGDLFQKWGALADEYACAASNWTACNRTKLETRSKACKAVALEYARPPIAPSGSFSVVISHAPFRNRLRVLARIEKGLQSIAEVHSIFIVVQGTSRAAVGLAPTGPKPVVEVYPPFDALGSRFGPLSIPTDAVLVMDDDILMEPRDIRYAFGAWQHTRTQLLGTWMRAVYLDENSGKFVYRSQRAAPDGMRRQNIALTKFMFLHRHYLFMYSCMLPFSLWDIPNRRLNCEDVLMNLLVGSASGLPPVPFQPVHAPQLDYGTPPSEDIQDAVVPLAGLSGSVRSEFDWAIVRSSCSHELVTRFNGSANLLVEPAYQATAPWMNIPYDKRWIDSTSGAEYSSNYSMQYTRYFDVIGEDLFMGNLVWSNDTDSPVTPKVAPMGGKGAGAYACPTRHDVLNTARAHRWRIWDDSPNNCSAGCSLKWCQDGTLAPCCVRRQRVVSWPIPCASLPHGCANQSSPLIQRFGMRVNDKGMTIAPTLESSLACPLRHDVINTPPWLQWSLWSEDEQKDCPSGCYVAWCQGGARSPCCVHRKQAKWAVPCDILPNGCEDLQDESRPKVTDGGALAAPTVSASRYCPLHEDIANTVASERWSIWDDETPGNATHGGAKCRDGCALSVCEQGTANPCCVRRRRVVSWSLPCSLLRYGCNTTAETTRHVVRDWQAVPELEPSFICPTRRMVINTYAALRWSIWDDPSMKDDCRFETCTSMAPCNVRRVRVAAWPVLCKQLPYRGCALGDGAHFEFGAARIYDRRFNAERFSQPWVRARYGREATIVNVFVIPAVKSLAALSLLLCCCCYACSCCCFRPRSSSLPQHHAPSRRPCRFMSARWAAAALTLWAIFCAAYLWRWSQSGDTEANAMTIARARVYRTNVYRSAWP